MTLGRCKPTLLTSFPLTTLYPPYGATAPSGPGPLHDRDFTMTLKHQSVRLLWTMIIPTQRPLLDNTQNSQETGVHASGGIRTRNPRKREAADTNLLHKENMTYFVNYTAYW
jgi:hypothetical protein